MQGGRVTGCLFPLLPPGPPSPKPHQLLTGAASERGVQPTCWALMASFLLSSSQGGGGWGHKGSEPLSGAREGGGSPWAPSRVKPSPILTQSTAKPLRHHHRGLTLSPGPSPSPTQGQLSPSSGTWAPRLGSHSELCPRKCLSRVPIHCPLSPPGLRRTWPGLQALMLLGKPFPDAPSSLPRLS